MNSRAQSCGSLSPVLRGEGSGVGSLRSEIANFKCGSPLPNPLPGVPGRGSRRTASRCTGIAAPVRLKPDPQPVRPVNVQPLARLPRLVTGQLEPLDPLQEVPKRDPRLQPGQRRAEA